MRGSRWWVWAIAAAVVVAVVIGAVLLGSGSGGDADATAQPSESDATDETSTATATPDPVPTPAPTSTSVAAEDDGQALVTPYLGAEAAARQDPSQPLELEQVATGTALEDLQIQVDELTTGGLVQVGAPTVVSSEITESDPDGDPPTATVLVCLDYSDVDVVNASGESAKDDTAVQRVPTLLELVLEDGSWLVQNRTFPSEASC